MLKYYDRVCKMLKRIHLSEEFKAKIDPPPQDDAERRLRPDKLTSGFNRSDIQKFVAWCKYRQERVYFSSVTQSIAAV